MNRSSVVKNIKINAILNASIANFGDSKIIDPKAKVLAIQRDIPIFYEDEGNFKLFPLFSRPIPEPIITEKIQMTVKNINPYIKVNNIKIVGISASSILQVGTTQYINSEARIKHIRQLLRGEYPV